MKKAHFIGIAGKGMSATALLLKQAGWSITGSDSGAYPPISSYLIQNNILFNKNYNADNIPSDADLIIIGKNAKLKPEENSEVKAAFDSDIPINSFPEIINDLTRDKETVVVTGSYGKSTITALITWCLKESGKDPSYFIGEITKGLNEHAHLGNSDIFVLEGDEYPSSHQDSRAKFLHYNAKDVILTSALHDHINIFPTQEDYLKPFKELLGSLPQDGLLIFSKNEKYANLLAEDYKGEKINYGFDSEPEWGASNISYNKTTKFDLQHNKEKVIEIETSLLGRHNIENIIGASAFLLTKKLITEQELSKAVKTFEGVTCK